MDIIFARGDFLSSCQRRALARAAAYFSALDMLGVGTGIVVLVADDDKTFVCVSDERAGQQNSL
jgi:hypothetical protein